MARAPEVFPIDPAPAPAPRPPVVKAPPPAIITETPDVFADSPVSEPVPQDRRSWWGRLFVGAATAFVGLAVSLWFYDFVAGLMTRWPALGYVALALAALAGLALAVLVVREVVALLRLGSAARLRAETDAALAAGTTEAARGLLARIDAFYARDATTARGRAALAGHAGEIIDGKNLVLLAERELLADKDRDARTVIAAAASRVAMVTTLSPRAWVDIAFVLAQSVRLISKVAAIYSGRPGGLATWRLAARVLTHLAVTGGVAVANDAIGQFLGAGLAGRLSSKLGEGMLNGVLTARVGLSAIAVCRPMPFRAFKPPTLAEVAGSLLSAKPETAKPAG